MSFPEKQVCPKEEDPESSSRSCTSSPASLQQRWSIAIKTVGAEGKHRTSQNQEKQPTDFVLQLSPQDSISTLVEKIQNVTGLSQEEQRLIYRGRIIPTASTSSGGGENRKLQDVDGLQDGHTIHLVQKKLPKLDAATSPTTTSPEPTAENTGGNNSALESSSTTPEVPSRRTWRRSRRRMNHRLTEEDLTPADPGSMESVRQGLLTLHTMLPLANQRLQSPLDMNRQWYVGQWVDARDTVREWLEATIIDIVYPDTLLPFASEAASSLPNNRTGPIITPTSDPFVHADDLDGRLRLLLEPCHDSDPRSLGGELTGLRRRDTNEGIQLLLIHYNGWPHRWDEWIRSDSERIRPFRVRTRHPSSSSTVAPTPMSSYADSPSTHFVSEDDTRDRRALLSELSRVTSVVSELLANQASRISPISDIQEDEGSENHNQNLPWLSTGSGTAACDRTDDSTDDEASQFQSTPQPSAPPLSRRELQTLASFLDRLGRTLVDAAPHVASLAAGVDVNAEVPTESQESAGTLGGLLSLLRDRRRRSLTNTSTNAAIPEDNTVSERTTATTESSVIIDPDYTDFVSGLVNTTRGEVRTGPRSRRVATDHLSELLGAYVAASSLSSLAGEDAETSLLARLLRDRSPGGPGIDIHIHAVVSSPDEGGTGTGAELLPALGLTGFPGGILGMNTRGIFSDLPETAESPTPRERAPRLSFTRSRNGSSTRSANTERNEEDDLGIFSELYSENPNPVNLNVEEPGHMSSRSFSPGRQSSGASNARPSSTPRSSRSRTSATPGRRSVLGRFFGRSSRAGNN